MGHPASMFVSPRVGPAGGKRTGRLRVDYSMLPAPGYPGPSARPAECRPAVSMAGRESYLSTGNSGSTQDQNGRPWAARLGYNLDSADIAPGKDPVCSGSGGHNYKTSNQNQGRLQRYTSLQTVRGKYSVLHQESRKYKGPRPRTISKNQVECRTGCGYVSSFSAKEGRIVLVESKEMKR